MPRDPELWGGKGAEGSPRGSPLAPELPSRTWDFTETDLTAVTPWDDSERHKGQGGWWRRRFS